MNFISKPLAILVVVGSMAFMGFSLVSAVGGPNWQRTANELDSFAFEKPATPEGSWTVTSRALGGERVGEGKILPAAIVVAQRHKLQNQDAEKLRLNQELPKLETRLAQAKALIQTDLNALLRRQEAIVAEHNRLREQIGQLSQQINDKSAETKGVFDLANLRREDYLLMKNQLEEVRLQQVSTEAEVRRLRDQLIQTQGVLERAVRREKLLRADGAKVE